MKEDEQFAALRKFGLSFSSWAGTDFRSANLQCADFTGAFLRGTRFDKESNLTNVCFRNAVKAEFAQFAGTIMENKVVRELLVTYESKIALFEGLNLRGAWLRGADLRNKDFRYTDLRSADLRKADMTGIRLYGASREEWRIDGVKCDYVYLDEKGKERYPKDKDFAPGEFEEFYQSLAAINENLIERFIEFPPEYHQAGMSVLNYFGSVLKKKYPDTEAKIKIEQDGLRVKMVIDPVDGGKREVIEETLDDYGLVIKGEMTPEEFFSGSPQEILSLRHKLDMAAMEIKHTYELLHTERMQYENRISHLESEVGEMRSLVGQAIQSQPNVTVYQTKAEEIQGLTQTDKVGTLNQKYENTTVKDSNVGIIGDGSDVSGGINKPQ